MVLIVTGVVTLPPNIYLNLAIWFISWSRHTPRKSININSATGLKPVRAAPPAAPIIADSVIGVSITRSVPNFSDNPKVTPYTPPECLLATSSPITITVWSLAISSWSVLFIASLMEISAISMPLIIYVNICVQLLIRWLCCRIGFFQTSFYKLRNFIIYIFNFFF